MNLLQLALAYVVHRRMVSCLVILSIGLGSALMLVVVNARHELERGFFRHGGGYDLVVAVPGSETAAVLGSLFLADQPRGNIPFTTYLQVARQPGVLAAYPLCMGDQYQRAPVVGVGLEFFQQRVPGSDERLYPVAAGRLFESDFELVAGASAAARLGLTLNERVTTVHGGIDSISRHDQQPYTVVGILAPTGTPYDRGLFATLGSYWRIHGIPGLDGPKAPAPGLGGGDVTYLLLRVSKTKLLQLPEQLRVLGVMTVRPAPVLQQLFHHLLSPLERLLLAYGGAVVLVASLSILTTLFLSTLLRRRDLALLRVLGARASEIFTLVLMEAMVLVTLGGTLGILLAQGAMALLWSFFQDRWGVETRFFHFTPAEVCTLLFVVILGMIAALLPAWHAYRRDLLADLTM